MSKYKTIKAVAEQYQNFPFKQQMYAIYSLSQVLNTQVYFEHIENEYHIWYVQASNGRKLGQFILAAKVEK